MALARRVEVRPAKDPTVVRYKGYEFVTMPAHSVRIHVKLTQEERELCARAITSHEERRPFRATRCEWDKCDKSLDHSIVLTYYIHDNSFNLTDPHRIVAAAINEIHRFVIVQRRQSRKKD